MAKEDAKEEGAVTKHISVVYSDKRNRTIIIYSVVAAIILIICVCAACGIAYGFIQPRVPRFTLDDLYVDPLSSNSSVLVKLSSTNPSRESSVYYRKIGLHLSIAPDFETEKFFLENTHQRPREVKTWTAVVATNSYSVTSGTFQMRSGVKDGDIIVDLSIQWKSGIFKSSKIGVRVTCPVLLRLKDLTSAVRQPSKCSNHFA